MFSGALLFVGMGMGPLFFTIRSEGLPLAKDFGKRKG